MEFKYQVEDHGRNRIVYETEEGQRCVVSVEEGTPVLYVNREACVFLAKLFVQLAHSNLQSGFHVHLGENLDPEAPEAIRVVLQ